MSRTAEYALEAMCRSLARQERSEQLKKMEAACDSKTLAAIVADNRTSVFLPSDPGAKVRVSGAGTVVDGETRPRGTGWQEVPRPLAQPPGIREIDEIAKAFDRADRRKGLL
jgi:hypothetical protein